MILNAVGENLFLINNLVILKSQNILGSKILYLEIFESFYHFLGLSWKGVLDTGSSDPNQSHLFTKQI